MILAQAAVITLAPQRVPLTPILLTLPSGKVS